MQDFSLASFNHQRAQVVIDSLYQSGVEHFAIAPGSRSTPLTLAIAEHSSARSEVHFDERGLGYFALGLAKALNKPVGIVVTTATAAANLMPAVMEAHLSRIPLILLLADRPPELRDCGANQTADQIKLYSSMTRWEVDLAFSDPFTDTKYLQSTLSYAVKRSQWPLPGPVEVNCMIREPFITETKQKPSSMPSCVYEESSKAPSCDALSIWAELLNKSSSGVILLGSEALEKDEIEPFLTMAEKLSWPIFSDIISGGRALRDHRLHIERYELTLKASKAFNVKTVLQIGNRFVSKFLLHWLKETQPESHLLVKNHPQRHDPLHSITRVIECPTRTFCRSISELLVVKSAKEVCDLKATSIGIKKNLEEYFLEPRTFSEPFLMHSLKDTVAQRPLYLSSSMPIRDADLLFYPQIETGEIFCNRGASGIDGNIATAAGLAKGLTKPLVAVIGDLAFLHDLSSLALIQASKSPVILIVINNGGGGIFSFLPVAKEKAHFETFVATAHTYRFASIAQSFGLSYKYVETPCDWNEALDAALKENKTCLIECITERQANVDHHRTLENLCIDSAFAPT